MAPADATKTFYKIIVAGPSMQVFGQLPESLAGNNHADEWRSANFGIGCVEWVFEFAIPCVCNFLPAEELAQKFKNPEVMSMAIGLVQQCENAGLKIGIVLEDSDHWGALRLFVRALVDNESKRNVFLKQLMEASIVNPGSLAAKSQRIAQTAAIYVKAVNKLFAAIDLGVVIANLKDSKPFEVWDAAVMNPNVRLQAVPTDKVSLSNSTGLLCTTGISDSEGPKRYKWSTDSSGWGHFIYNGENRGTSFNSSENNCRFIAHDTHAAEGQAQKVKVKVFLTEVEDVEIGSAETVLYYTKTIAELQPDPAIVSNCGIITLKAYVNGKIGTGLYNFHWSTDGEYAILEDFTKGHSGRDFWTTDSNVKFIAMNDLPPSMKQTVHV